VLLYASAAIPPPAVQQAAVWAGERNELQARLDEVLRAALSLAKAERDTARGSPAAPYGSLEGSLCRHSR
jgi:hypothetical protein